jgi:hypothetical protein
MLLTALNTLVRKIMNAFYGVIIPPKQLMLWLFGDVVFAVLPIIIILIIRIAFGITFDGFLLISEWSFASIVLFGLSIRSLLDLKIHYKKDYSDNLDIETQVFIFMLIISVLSLSFTLLNELAEEGLPNIAEVDDHFVVIIQIAMFLIALGSSLRLVRMRHKFMEEESNMPDKIEKNEYYNHLERNLDEATANINHAAYLVSRYRNIEVTNASDYLKSHIFDRDKYCHIDSTLKRMEQSIQELRIAYHELQNASFPKNIN